MKKLPMLLQLIVPYIILACGFAAMDMTIGIGCFYGIILIFNNVFPDLIIHERKNNDNNLLVVEFKKGPAKTSDKAEDIKKLKYFKVRLLL